MTPAAKSGKPAAHAASRAFAEAFVPESDQVALARRAAREMGLTPASTGTVAMLTFLARSVHARAVVEIGTGAGVSGLALLAGVASAGVLTSIDPENEHQVAARQVFNAAAVPSRRRLNVYANAGAPVGGSVTGSRSSAFAESSGKTRIAS